MRISLIALILASVGVGGGLAFMYSGLADVAATSAHWPLTKWVLSTTMKNAVRQKAEDIEPPPFLEEVPRVRAGAVAYDDMCISCHGAPGVEPGVLAKGLNPEPPELSEVAEQWTSAELFWITRHGVKMTGMPGFGPTHSDEELWEIVAFLRAVPAMSSEKYRALTGPDPAEGRKPTRPHEHDHKH